VVRDRHLVFHSRPLPGPVSFIKPGGPRKILIQKILETEDACPALNSAISLFPLLVLLFESMSLIYIINVSSERSKTGIPLF